MYESINNADSFNKRALLQSVIFIWKGMILDDNL